MIVRKLFRLSVPCKRLITLTHVHTQILHHSEKIDENKVFDSEDTNDKLFNVFNSSFPTRILLHLENNIESIESMHILDAIANFHKAYKKVRSDYNYKAADEWIQQDFFKQFCSIINVNISKLSSSEALQILDVLNRMKVSSSTEVVQSLLEHIHQEIDNLSFIEFNSLLLLIKKMPVTPLINKIQSSLSNKFFIKMAVDFEEDNIEHLINILSFLNQCPNSKQQKLLRIFFKKLQNYKHEITEKNAILILEILCNMNTLPADWLNVLHKVQNEIINNIDKLNSAQVNFIIFIISEGIKTNYLDELYNEELMDKLVEKIINDDLGFENAVNALKCLSFIRYVNIKLLNYTCAAYFERTTLVEKVILDETQKLLILINGLAAARYKTLFWNDLESYIQNNKTLLNYKFETLCILALNLLCLNCYPIHIFEKIFSVKFDESFNNYLLWSFCKIYQKLKLESHYKGPMPSDSQIKSLQNLYKNVYINGKITHKLLCNLEEGMGAPVYVKTNVATKLFHNIDYVVVFDKNGVAVPINNSSIIDEAHNNIEYLEDLKVPPDSQIIVILYLPYFWFSRNTNELLGTHKMQIETLKKISYSVIIINDKTWKNIPDKEKTSFIMNEIKSKVKHNKVDEI